MAQLLPADGYSSTVVASQDGSAAVFGGLLYDALKYNPLADTWLTVNQQGYDDVVEITRGNEFRILASNFDLGGLGGNHFSVTDRNFAWAGEVHKRSVYQITPATQGASQVFKGYLPDDTNGGGCPELGVSEADANGDLIAGFGPHYPSASWCPAAQPGAPRDWFRVTPEGNVSKLFTTSNSSIKWLRRDAVTGIFYGIDVYDPNQLDPAYAYMNYQAPRLVSLDLTAGTVSVIKQYSGMTLDDPEVDRTGNLTPAHVIWAVKDANEIVAIDPLTGNLGAPIAVAAPANSIVGLALAPASKDRGVRSLYALVSERTASGLTVRLVEIAASQDVYRNRAPVCSSAKASPSLLWPPKHSMVNISVTGIRDPDDDPVTTTVTAVTQDEAVNGLGDGDTGPDAQVDAGGVALRAERSGTGNGRVYQLSVRAEDGRGGSCVTTLNVCVPVAGPQDACVGDGQQYDSLAH